jgi:hypothetical protein
MSTAKEYEAKAKEAQTQLDAATSEAERSRLRRARGVYLKLAANVDQAAARIAARVAVVKKPAKKIGTGLFK